MIMLSQRCKDASRMQLSTALNTTPASLLSFPICFLFLPKLQLQKWLKIQSWKSTHCSHCWLAPEMPILLMLPPAHAAFCRQAPKHYSPATFACLQQPPQLQNAEHFHLPLLSTSLLLRLYGKIMKISLIF